MAYILPIMELQSLRGHGHFIKCFTSFIFLERVRGSLFNYIKLIFVGEDLCDLASQIILDFHISWRKIKIHVTKFLWKLSALRKASIYNLHDNMSRLWIQLQAEEAGSYSGFWDCHEKNQWTVDLHKHTLSTHPQQNLEEAGS